MNARARRFPYLEAGQTSNDDVSKRFCGRLYQELKSHRDRLRKIKVASDRSATG